MKIPIGTEKKVCEDVADRQTKGTQKYGVSVADRPLPLRGWLQHAYEECLDQAIYLRRAIDEIDEKPTNPERSDECPNCGEKCFTCACVRNKCVGCGNPVGNITFTYCSDCL